MNIKSLCFSLLLPIAGIVYAQTNIEFDKFFSDSTLRLDYTFSGNAQSQTIGLKSKIATENWYGKRNHLPEIPLKGNGALRVIDNETGNVLYNTSFSSLFLEWLDTEESATDNISMEHTVLIPMPQKEANIEIEIYNHRGEICAKCSNKFTPNDILIKRPKHNNPYEYKYILYSGSPKKKIDVAIVGEGYTKEETDSFFVHAERAVQSIVSHEPFKSMQDKFNFIAVATLSEDSGITSPSEGEWKNTCFNSNYDTFYAKRYLTTAFTSLIHDALLNIPYEHIIVLANTEQYGGGGIYNSYALTTAKNEYFWPVVTHEFGHSFGGLADEYFYENGDVLDSMYSLDIEPWEQNITTLVNFDKKWSDMIDKDTPIPTPVCEENEHVVGVYEGAGYCIKGIYRPLDQCRMRSNKVDYFCPVCVRSIKRIIEFYTE